MPTKSKRNENDVQKQHQQPQLYETITITTIVTRQTIKNYVCALASIKEENNSMLSGFVLDKTFESQLYSVAFNLSRFTAHTFLLASIVWAVFCYAIVFFLSLSLCIISYLFRVCLCGLIFLVFIECMQIVAVRAHTWNRQVVLIMYVTTPKLCVHK